LATYGVDHMVITSSDRLPHPAGAHHQPAAMEIFRDLGIEPEVAAQAHRMS
jgi:hypothetical protein